MNIDEISAQLNKTIYIINRWLNSFHLNKNETLNKNEMQSVTDQLLAEYSPQFRKFPSQSSETILSENLLKWPEKSLIRPDLSLQLSEIPKHKQSIKIDPNFSLHLSETPEQIRAMEEARRRRRAKDTPFPITKSGIEESLIYDI